MTDLSNSRWLPSLVESVIASPTPARDPNAPHVPAADPLHAFLEPLRQDVRFALAQAEADHRAEGPEWKRAWLASLLAASVGEPELAVAANPDRPHKKSTAAVDRAFAVTAGALVERSWPPADPRGGVPLRPGLLAIQREGLVRLAGDQLRGRMDRLRARRRFAETRAETVFLFEALAGLLGASGALPPESNRAVLAQLRRLDLPRAQHRRVRSVLTAPRSPHDLALAAPPRLRRFLLEQLLVAEVACPACAREQAAFISSFASASAVPEEELPALRAGAAARCVVYQRWIDPRPVGAPADEERLAREWEEAAQRMMERVADSFSDNVDALVTELRETGELGQLLARAAAGHTLTASERRKVKAQLIDLAKVVPALAIFAAPGGMILLPLLSKMLPFSVLPSAWHQEKPRPPLAPAPAPVKRTGSD